MAVSGQVACHCGQDVPGYLAGPGRHVRPSGGTCSGIDVALHAPGICWECRQGTHGAEFERILETIRWETRPESDGF